MSSKTLDNIEAAVAYNRLSRSVAIDSSFVQGGGGNVSVKFSGGIHIKASGTRLDDSTTNFGFVTLSLSDSRTKVELDEEFQYVLTKNSLLGKPSIEAPLHLMCKGIYVAHVHSVGAISVGLINDFKEICNQNHWIPIEYKEPGLPLLDALMETSFKSEEEGCALLRNHGLLVWSDDLDKCIDLLINAEQRCRVISQARQINYRGSPQDLMSVGISYQIVDFNSTLDERWFAFVCDNVLVPDQAVFLWNLELRKLQIEKNVIKLEGLSNTQIEIVHLLWLIGHFVTADECKSLIPSREIEKIVNLETEKYRRDISQ